ANRSELTRTLPRIDKLGVTGSSPVPPTSETPASPGVFVFRSGVEGRDWPRCQQDVSGNQGTAVKPRTNRSPTVNDEDQTLTSATLPESGKTALEKFEAWGVRGILRQLARNGQIIDV